MPFYHLIFSAFLCTENQELKNLSLRSEVKGVKADTSLAVLCTYSKTIGSNFPNERLLLFSGIR